MPEHDSPMDTCADLLRWIFVEPLTPSKGRSLTNMLTVGRMAIGVAGLLKAYFSD